MTKYGIYPFVVVCLLLQAPSATANFGFGPCCPPSVCGFIPCDSGCAGAAINQMGAAVANSLNGLNSSYQNITNGIQDTMDSMTNLGADGVSSLTQQNNKLLVALSAATNRIELANTVVAKTLERNADHTNTSFVNALKQMEVARATSENIKMFGGLSQPVSGDTGTNQALAIKKINVQMSQISSSSTIDFIRYLKDENDTISGAGMGQHRTRSLKALSDFDRLYRFLTDSTLDDDDFKSLQMVIGLITSKYPLAESSLAADIEYGIERKRHIAMLAMAYHALLMPASSRIGLDDADWAGFYQDVDPNAQNKIGLTGFFHAEINGKVSDPEWWGAVRRLTVAGLEREKVYQSALSSQLKDRLALMSETSNGLMALLLIKKTEYAAKKLKQIQEQI